MNPKCSASLITARLNNLHAEAFYNVRFLSKSIQNRLNKNIPSFEEHLEWYKKQDMQKMFLIYDNAFVGYVRISPANYISIAVKEDKCNKGYGTFGLKSVTQTFKHLKANINNDNEESIKLFLKFPCIEVLYES